MADRDFEIGGSPYFKQRFVDLGNNVYAKAVALVSLISGEDTFNHRMKVENQPADEDSILELLFNAVTSATSGASTATINVKGYKSVTLQVITTGSPGTFEVTFEATTDDSNWVAVAMIVGNSTSRALATTTATVGMFHLPEETSYSQIRVNITNAIDAGTLTVKSRKAPR